MMMGRNLAADGMLLEVLSRYMSPILARSVLGRAMNKANVSTGRATEADLVRIIPLLEDGARLFVDPAQHGTLRRDLASLQGAQASVVEKRHIPVQNERDISLARTAAREMVERMGARPLIAQRVATAVSELARNIVSYTPGGDIELIPVQEPKRAIIVRATDRGTGIPNLDVILSGKYKSSTGLGVGIKGTRRLSDRFEIETGAKGTCIEAEFRL